MKISWQSLLDQIRELTDQERSDPAVLVLQKEAELHAVRVEAGKASADLWRGVSIGNELLIGRGMPCLRKMSSPFSGLNWRQLAAWIADIPDMYRFSDAVFLRRGRSTELIYFELVQCESGIGVAADDAAATAVDVSLKKHQWCLRQSSSRG